MLATGRDQERLAELVRSAPTESGGAITGYPADLAEPAAADNCVAAAVSAFGKLDGLVHSAGVHPPPGGPARTRPMSSGRG